MFFSEKKIVQQKMEKIVCSTTCGKNSLFMK